MEGIGRFLVGLIGVTTIVVTALPLLKVDYWWVRVWDFPRPQILAIGGAAFLLCIALSWPPRGFALVLTLGVMVAGLYHAFRILPFTPLWPKEVAEIAAPQQQDRCLSVLVANVQMENRDSDALIALIRERDPDIVFLPETDGWWTDALSGIIDDYAHHRLQPQDNYYGLSFLSKLPVEEEELRTLIQDDVPSIRARLRLPSGDAITFIGLHPRPPTINVNSDKRDAELILVAREVEEADGPVIVGGDLNDVAWSSTTRLFKRISNMLDPRVGRGLYSSFHAQQPLMRWPLDHIFHTNDFELVALEVLPSIGSDHFPVFARLCRTASAEMANGRPQPKEDGDEERADDIIENGKDE